MAKKIPLARAVCNLIGTVIGINLKRTAEARTAQRQAEDALDRLHLAEARKKQIEANTTLAQIRTLQIPEQTRGITERYRATQENRVNAMLRQIRQEDEIKLLRLKIEMLERELGHSKDEFEPDNYKET